MDRRILVIDDDADTLELMTTLLSHQVKVSTAINIKEAMEQLKREFIDVVVCDVNLGGENGFHLIEDLQSNLVEIPFIIISGDVDPEKEARAKKLGALAIIEKPFEFESLLETIEKGLDPLRRLREAKARRLARSA
jgi:DNA-binding NtrC family response regulator